ncbi:hypothetical protein A2U01_0074268, partial [Trifolium medium]|nr:hypothetical protein [Trifolium medium]
MAILAVTMNIKKKPKIKGQKTCHGRAKASPTVVIDTTDGKIASGKLPTAVPMLHTAVAVPKLAIGNFSSL